jgi:hypothetical protein
MRSTRPAATIDVRADQGEGDSHQSEENCRMQMTSLMCPKCEGEMRGYERSGILIDRFHRLGGL